MSYNGYCRLHSKEVGFFDTSCDDYAEPQGSLMETTNTAPATKVCKTCGRQLTLDHFGGHHRTADHLQTSCKECMSAKIKKTKKAAPAAITPSEADPIELIPIPEPEVKHEPTCNLDDYTSQALYDELRRRGWQGTLSKVITLC